MKFLNPYNANECIKLHTHVFHMMRRLQNLLNWTKTDSNGDENDHINYGGAPSYYYGFFCFCGYYLCIKIVEPKKG